MQHPLKYRAAGPSLKTSLDTQLLDRCVADMRAYKDVVHHDLVVLDDFTPISRQVGGSCVANAFVDGLEILMGLRTRQPVPQLSRMAAYSWSRARHGETDRDNGTYPYYMAQQLQLVGTLLESRWPNTKDNLLRCPPNHLIVEASDNRVEGIHQIEETGQALCDMVEWALRGGCPVEAAAGVNDAFQNVGAGEVVDAITSGIEGGHSMLLTGVRLKAHGVREFLLRNSWGEDWGTKGRTWVTEAFVRRMYDPFLLTLMKDLVTS